MTFSTVARYALYLLVVALLLLPVPFALAQTGNYAIDWWTINGGGGSSSGGGYLLNGTIGQVDAGAMTGGNYAVNGGFWKGGTIPSPGYSLYLPLLLR